MLDYVLGRLDASRGRLPDIAEAAGVPYRTLQKISLRVTTNPRIGHIQKLHDYFRGLEEETAWDVSVFKQMGQMCCPAKRVFCASFSCYAACR